MSNCCNAIFLRDHKGVLMTHLSVFVNMFTKINFKSRKYMQNKVMFQTVKLTFLKPLPSSQMLPEQPASH